MLKEFMFSVMVGTALGVLSGLGTGGGSLLILWLTLVLNLPQHEARTINLLFFIPSAIISCLFRWKQGTLRLKKVLPAIAAGSIVAGIFSFFGSSWDAQLLKKAFGALLLLTGLRELAYRPKNE